MRPNQNNNNNKNRQRGRNNNNGGRKHVNPLSRNFESNGPDVKVRGNAAHVAEKYLQLARDAQSSGDPVLAENYLQHAEHYFRIVAAAQPQNQFRPDQPGQQQEMDDDDFEPINDRFASPEPRVPFQPQQAEQPGSFGGDSEEGAEPQAQQPAPQSQGAEPAMAEDGQSANAQQGEGGEARRDRNRNRRRRGRGPGEGGQGNGDPGGAPQPDVGELPAFLTAGGPAVAE
jgi:hypothetical protein